MLTRFAVAAFLVTIMLPAGINAGQSPASGSSSAKKTWRAPRTASGHPDLQGVWANNVITPLQRPKIWEGREVLTTEEVEILKQKVAGAAETDGDAIFAGEDLIQAALSDSKAKSYDPTTGNYNHFWLVERDYDNRTSLIVEPSNGRLPALTPAAQTRQQAAAERRRLHPADGPEDRPLGERCITFGSPRLGAGYNSYYQILQTPDHVVIMMEMAHDARVIPLDGRPHVPDRIRQWHGDSRGRWEGDTLVVETRNYSPKSNFMGAAENLHVVERFTRVGPTTLKYEVSISDPTTWTEPWTAVIPLKHSDDKVYEYACHEGNIGLFGILSGHRAEEAAGKNAGSTQ